MELSWTDADSAHSYIWLCFPTLEEGKSRTFIALNCILGTVMSAPAAHLAVDLEGSASSSGCIFQACGGEQGNILSWDPRKSGSTGNQAVAVPGTSTLCLFGDFL